jgi:hypothetical protein
MFIGVIRIDRRQQMKKVIDRLEHVINELGPRYVSCYARYLLDRVIAELKAPPSWETPEQWEKCTGEKYPDEAPVWTVSKYAIDGKPTKYNRLRWWLGTYKEAKDNEVNSIVFCAYNHLGPPPKDWRPEEENNAAE